MHDIPLQTHDGSFTLDSHRYGETYHSTNGALTEAQHVFLDATGISERLRRGLDCRVLEIGFGLGLNALLTCDLALQHNAPLHYHSYEHDLVAADTIDALAYDSLLTHAELLDSTLALLRGAARTADTLHSNPAARICLTLHLKDASSACLRTDTQGSFHAIYLDAFSPDTNPECWSPAFFTQLENVLVSGGRLSTYSAKGAVRRAMLAAGFKVQKQPGPPGKRDMLIACKAV